MSQGVFKIGDGAIKLILDTSGMTDAAARGAVMRAGAALGPAMGTAMGAGIMGPLGAAIAAASAVAGFGAYGVKQWAGLQSAQVDLAAALSLTGKNTEGLRGKYADLALGMSQLTRLTREQVYELATMAITMGAPEASVDRMTHAAVGLAAAYRLDVHTAMMLLIRASQGHLMMLERHGIVIHKTGNIQHDFNQLLELGEKRLELEAAKVGTLAGQMTMLGKTTKEAGATFGEQLGPTVADALKDIKSVMDGIDWKSWGTKAVGELEPLANLLHSIAESVQWAERMKDKVPRLGVHSTYGALEWAAGGIGGWLGNQQSGPQEGPSGRSVGTEEAMRMRMSARRQAHPERFGAGAGGGAADESAGLGILPGRNSFASFEAAWKGISTPHDKLQERIAKATEGIERNTSPKSAAPGRAPAAPGGAVMGA